jgi:uncharacterized membrane protein YedE/YeeE
MLDILPDRLPWYIGGPMLGVLIVAMFALANQPLGASGAYVQTASLIRGRANVAKWRVWYFAGMFAGGLLVTQVLRADSGFRPGYDALTDVFPTWAVLPMVFGGATLLGYGAAVAGGCTSGHGMCGTAQRSPASVAVTVTFMVVAIATTFVLRVMTGGAL